MKFLTKKDLSVIVLVLTIVILTVIGSFVLRSVFSNIFSTHLIYLGVAFILFFILTKIDWDVFYAFSPHLFILSIFLLLTTLIIGRVTRGAVRWIPLGDLSIQPSEVVRAFLLLYWAKFISEKEVSIERIMKLFVIFFVPFILIVIQPSLGVALLTAMGFLGILLSSSIPKKYFLIGTGLLIAMLPLVWFILQPYQKDRILAFIDPESDPQGAGYNSIQSMISVGSGGIFGRGLGKGVQTQLAFLPERHNDFIFASIAEELGFVGAFLVLIFLFVFFWILVGFVSQAKDLTARSYLTGVIFVFFSQTLIHVGMNVKLLPITGVPLPFVSAGGSSLLGTIIAVSVAIKARKD